MPELLLLLWQLWKPRRRSHNAVRSPRLYSAGEWTPERAQKAIGGAAEAGLDFVEIPLLRPESMDITATRALLDRYGIGCTCSLGLPKATHLPSAPEKAQSFLESAVDVAAGLEAPVLCGVLYAHLGSLTGRPPEQEELEDVARVLKNVARYAAERGVSLGVEAVNRYETYLINLAEQADAMLDRVGEPNVFVDLDTYHMNIEEKGFYEPIVATGPRCTTSTYRSPTAVRPEPVTPLGRGLPWPGGYRLRRVPGDGVLRCDQRGSRGCDRSLAGRRRRPGNFDSRRSRFPARQGRRASCVAVIRGIACLQ